MKSIISIVIALAMMLTGACASASQLPEDIAAAFDDESWSGWEAAALDVQAREGASGDRAVAVMRKGGRNVLCTLERDGDTFSIHTMSALAVYSGDLLPTLSYQPGDIGHILMTYEDGADGYDETFHLRCYNGVWYVVDIQRTPGDTDGTDTEILISLYMSYILINVSQDAQSASNRVYGNTHRRLSAFDINNYGKDYEEAAALIVPPTVPKEGAQPDPLPQSVSAKLAQEGPHTVRTGPLSRYLSADSGAAVDSSTAIEVLGYEGNMALITYTAQDGGIRYGYIAQNVLEPLSGVYDLQFEYLRATTLEESELTDSPDGSGIVTLPAGTEVLYLATLGGDMSYVETTGTAPARGFVRSNSLAVLYSLEHREFDIYSTAFSAPDAVVTRKTEMIDDPYRRNEPAALLTLQAGDKVYYIDSLYMEWAYIAVAVDGEWIMGFIPWDAMESISGDSLLGNG